MAGNDFSKGPVWKCIVRQGVPLTIAQLVHLLYNVVDRIFIGHMDGGSSLALTGVGLTFPIVTLIMAVAALFGMGGVPLFSMERGAGNPEKAGKILGNSFVLLLISGLGLTAVGYLFCRPILFLFGASEASYVYAGAYLQIYLAGTVFSMIATGMNGYINAQGFPGIGMLSVVIGAGINIALDPLFIFQLGMGVSGAALATIISQMISAAWVMRFLLRARAEIPLVRRNLRLEKEITAGIVKLGISSFMMNGTTCLVQIVCNVMLQQCGGDLYVGIMTVLNSIRDTSSLPISGIVGGSQPVVSFNYGARDYKRVKAGIDFNILIASAYTLFIWLMFLLFPGFWFGIFTDDPLLTAQGLEMLRIYFFGFVFMALQIAGQSTFQSLGDARHSILFSLFRKVIIVVPLTVILPMAGFGVRGVFLAEPISNVVGGSVCFLTMRLTVYRKIQKGQPIR